MEVVRIGGGVRRRWLNAGSIAAELPLSRRKSQPTLVESASALKGVPIVITCRTRGAMSLPISRA